MIYSKGKLWIDGMGVTPPASTLAYLVAAFPDLGRYKSLNLVTGEIISNSVVDGIRETPSRVDSSKQQAHIEDDEDFIAAKTEAQNAFGTGVGVLGDLLMLTLLQESVIRGGTSYPTIQKAVVKVYDRDAPSSAQDGVTAVLKELKL